VRDYCTLLSEEFARRGDRLDVADLRWEIQGWRKALRRLWRDSRAWAGRWVLFQYTALMWSRRGFPLGALAVLWLLRLRGAKLCVVFHDVTNEFRSGLIQRIRVGFQYWAMRTAFRWASLCVLTVPVNQVPWLPRNAGKAVAIPVGANFSETERPIDTLSAPRLAAPAVAVFGITYGTQGREEIKDIGYAVKHAKSKLAHLRLVAFGRGSMEAESALREEFEGAGVELMVLGLLPAKQIRELLEGVGVMLCVRGEVSSRRGSAIAGIVCGLPIVGCRGAETGFPITEAGVLLFEKRDREGLAKALGRILTDPELYGDLRQRSLRAAREHFSWDAIAAQSVNALADR
jgi:glycosyltransferase involved in cell wall biosynthesis